MGIWWSGAEIDVLPAGDGAHGYKSIQFHNVGSDYPVFDDIRTHVVDAGLAAGDGSNIGTVLYNRGVYAAFLASEAAKDAQAATGNSAITAGDMRNAMEALEITAAEMDAAGLPGFGPEFSVTCENHGGDGMAAIGQWDANAQQWNLITDFTASDASVIGPLVEADSAAYAAENNIAERCN